MTSSSSEPGRLLAGSGERPPHFVGRRAELAAFQPTVRRVAEGGSGLVLVSGSAGSGKTMLLRAMSASLPDAVEAYGKYDSVRTRPYEGIAGALSQLAVRINESGVDERWRAELAEAVGDGAPALTSLVPELVPAIGEHSIPRLPDPEATLRRLLRACRGFVETAARRFRPLVLTIDDLQWAGTNSLDLIHDLADTEASGLLILTGTRELRQPEILGLIDRTDATHIEVGPFDPDAVGELLEILSGSPADDSILIQILKETDGNPQFVAELLRRDLDNGSLVLDQQTGHWSWKKTRRGHEDITDGLALLLLDRLNRVSDEEADLVSAAACLGTSFTVDDVALATRTEPDTVADAIRSPAVRELFSVDRTGRNGSILYRFAHDRIAEVAARRLTGDQAKAVRLRLGKELLKQGDERNSDAMVHIAAAAELLGPTEDRVDLAQRAFHAGFESRNSAAFSMALRHFDSGLGLLEGADGAGAEQLRSRLSVEAAEAAWLAGGEHLESRLRQASELAVGYPDRARLTAMRMKLDLAGHNPDAALRSGLETLGEVGIEFPERPTPLGLLRAVRATKKRLDRLGAEGLELMPPCEEEDAIVTEQILGEMFTTSYTVNPDLFPHVVVRGVDLTLDRGLLPMTPVALAGFGLLLVVLADTLPSSVGRVLLGDLYDDALVYGDLAVRLSEDEASVQYGPWTKLLYYNFIHHWHRSIHDSLPLLHQAQREAAEIGELTYGAYLGDCELAWLTAVGAGTTETVERGTELIADMGAGQDKQAELAGLVVESSRLLADPTKNGSRVVGDFYDERRVIERSQRDVERGEPEDVVSTASLWSFKLRHAVMTGDFSDVPYLVEQAEQRLDGLLATALIAHHKLIKAYGLMAAAPGARSTRSALRDALGSYRAWAEKAPVNYRAGLELLRGLDRHRRRNPLQARSHLDTAVKLAEDHNLTHVEGLAHLWLSRIADDGESSDDRQQHVVAAANAWRRMGNIVGLERLREENPDVAGLSDRDTVAATPGPIPGPSSSASPGEAAMDLLTTIGVDLTDPDKPKARNLTILVADIAKYMVDDDTLPAEQHALTSAFAEAARSVLEAHHGWVRRGHDDAVVAVFASGPEEALDAARSLIELHDRQNETAVRTGGRPIRVGVGIAYGTVELRTVESDGALQLEVAGSALEEARLAEASNHDAHTRVLVTDAATQQLGDIDRFEFRPVAGLEGLTSALRSPVFDRD